MASVIEKFDEEDREMAQALLEQYWIIREEQPELYQRLRRREQGLRNYFFDKCGFRLLVTRQFVKLEKIPARPAPCRPRGLSGTGILEPTFRS